MGRPRTVTSGSEGTVLLESELTPAHPQSSRPVVVSELETYLGKEMAGRGLPQGSLIRPLDTLRPVAAAP